MKDQEVVITEGWKIISSKILITQHSRVPLRDKTVAEVPSVEVIVEGAPSGSAASTASLAANSSSRDAVRQSVAEVPSVVGTVEPFRGSLVITSHLIYVLQSSLHVL